MAIGYAVSMSFPIGAAAIMVAPAVFAFGLVAFGFLGMGPVTIAVDSYGPVTDNAQSVYELSTIETLPNAAAEIERQYGFEPQFEKAKDNLEENDGAGNTFKATAKPVLIGTAVVGATTMIFSTIVALTDRLTHERRQAFAAARPVPSGHDRRRRGDLLVHRRQSAQAVTAGAYKAVEFIKRNINLESAAKASVADSKKVVGICTQYAQKGMINIFLTVFFATLAFAFTGPFFFVGYLISIALFGLFQAIFMANAGGAWDNAKKIVEVELKAKGTPLHDATVVGDTVGDPFKDTSSVALNPIIKFTTLFGLLAVELAVALADPAKNANGETICARARGGVPAPRHCASSIAASTACASATRRPRWKCQSDPRRPSLPVRPPALTHVWSNQTPSHNPIHRRQTRRWIVSLELRIINWWTNGS